MDDTTRQADRPRQGLFYAQTPNDETKSSIDWLVSEVGVPQNANDLANGEYQLVLHSIKQDLRAVLQRQAPAHADVDLKVLMHLEAPQQLKDILQGLVYVAKIKDVANTRGGAQVSQHRRVLAQQTYNMLVQELGDVLQGPAVQRRLRDLANASDFRPHRNNSQDKIVMSDAGLSALAPSRHVSQVPLSTLHRGMQGNMQELDSSTSSQENMENENEMPMRGSSAANSFAGELLWELDVDKNDVMLSDDIKQIEKAREQDAAANEQQISQTLEKSLEESIDEATKIEFDEKLRNLVSISKIRDEKFQLYDEHVKTYDDAKQSLHRQIDHLQETKGTMYSQNQLVALYDNIVSVNDEHRNFIIQTKQFLELLRERVKIEAERSKHTQNQT